MPFCQPMTFYMQIKQTLAAGTTEMALQRGSKGIKGDAWGRSKLQQGRAFVAIYRKASSTPCANPWGASKSE